MKKFWMILTAGLALMVSSCIEHHAVISVKKDGSGTVTEETTLGGMAVMMMAQMPEGQENPLKGLVDEEEAKEKAKTMGEGVTVEKVEAIDANGRKGGKITYAFADINKLKYSYGDSVSEMGEGMEGDSGPAEEAAEANKPILFSYKDGVLTVKNQEAAEAVSDEKEKEAPAEEVDEAGLAMAKQMMGDMKMSFKIEIPGGIAETNAAHVDGNTVTFMEMEMGKLLENPEKFKELNAAEPESIAEMQEILDGVEGVKVEAQEEVTIKLK